MTITFDEACKWLESQAAYYENANNAAMQTDSYRREDTTAWKVAVMIRNLHSAARSVCWFDWSTDNDEDAIAAIETLRAALSSSQDRGK